MLPIGPSVDYGALELTMLSHEPCDHEEETCMDDDRVATGYAYTDRLCDCPDATMPYPVCERHYSYLARWVGSDLGECVLCGAQDLTLIKLTRTRA